MVDLETVSPAEPDDDPEAPVAEPPSVVDNGMGDPLRFDAQRLRILVERHARLTGSAKAKSLLADWDNAIRQFVKIMPRDYRRAMLDLRAERNALAVAAQ
jgi:glutamate synthase (NADPH/NADH) large chain